MAQVIVEAATAAEPRLRYQSSEAASALAGRKIVDVTGSSLLGAMRGMIGLGAG